MTPPAHKTLWTAAELQQATGGAMPVPFDATGVSIDTRTLQPGDLFIALHAETDGHAHTATALAKGAAGILVHDPAAIPPGAPALLVPDTLAALTALGHAARTRFQGRLVAITGSVGKTTTKEMLRTVLAGFGHTHASPASYNNHWGVPLTLARIPPGTRFCVIEIGMNTAGEILPLARLAAPHVAVVTTIGSAHIGRLGSLDAIAHEKSDLLRGLLPGGTAILPASGHGQAILAAAAPSPVVTFGVAGDVHTVQAAINPTSSVVLAEIRGTRVQMTLHAPGAHMVENALAALATCAALGLDPAVAAAQLGTFAPGAGRGQQRPVMDGTVTLLDESYNASAASVRAALAVLARLPAPRHVAVLGDMLELGSHAEAEHTGLASDVAQAADLVYACGPLTQALFKRLPERIQGAHALNSAALAPIVAAALRPGDAVLVKGSLGSRMKLVVDAIERMEALSPAGAG